MRFKQEGTRKARCKLPVLDKGKEDGNLLLPGTYIVVLGRPAVSKIINNLPGRRPLLTKDPQAQLSPRAARSQISLSFPL